MLTNPGIMHPAHIPRNAHPPELKIKSMIMVHLVHIEKNYSNKRPPPPFVASEGILINGQGAN